MDLDKIINSKLEEQNFQILIEELNSLTIETDELNEKFLCKMGKAFSKWFNSAWKDGKIREFGKAILCKFKFNYDEAYKWTASVAKNARRLADEAQWSGDTKYLAYPEDMVKTIERTLILLPDIYKEVKASA